jgi:hypothetical protein
MQSTKTLNLQKLSQHNDLSSHRNHKQCTWHESFVSCAGKGGNLECSHSEPSAGQAPKQRGKHISGTNTLPYQEARSSATASECWAWLSECSGGCRKCCWWCSEWRQRHHRQRIRIVSTSCREPRLASPCIRPNRKLGCTIYLPVRASNVSFFPTVLGSISFPALNSNVRAYV